MTEKIKNIKRFWKPFIFLFLLSFLIINWSDISKIFPYFDYRVIHNEFSKPLANISYSLEGVRQLAEENEDYNYFDKKNIIEIPKIDVEAPIIFTEQDNEENFEEILKKGVLYYPSSVKPGEEGITVILGHSAPLNWPEINYDGVFTDLNKLETGDIIYIYFNHRQYSYKVRNKFFLEKGEEISSLDLTNSKSMLILLSCWPPGKNQNRIAVEAVLQ